jgi:uncharacterized protein YbaR (Trm112 family)
VLLWQPYWLTESYLTLCIGKCGAVASLVGGIMDHRLLEIVACPVCNGKLYFNKESEELVCKLDGLAYPVRDGIPVLLEEEARTLSEDEIHP